MGEYDEIYNRLTHSISASSGSAFKELAASAVAEGFPIDYIPTLEHYTLLQYAVLARLTKTDRSRAFFNCPTQVSVLIDLGADVNVLDKDGRNILMAISEEMVEIGDFQKDRIFYRILNRTRDVNLQDNKRRTALGRLLTNYIWGYLPNGLPKINAMLKAGAEPYIDKSWLTYYKQITDRRQNLIDLGANPLSNIVWETFSEHISEKEQKLLDEVTEIIELHKQTKKELIGDSLTDYEYQI